MGSDDSSTEPCSPRNCICAKLCIIIIICDSQCNRTSTFFPRPWFWRLIDTLTDSGTWLMTDDLCKIDCYKNFQLLWLFWNAIAVTTKSWTRHSISLPPWSRIYSCGISIQEKCFLYRLLNTNSIFWTQLGLLCTSAWYLLKGKNEMNIIPRQDYQSHIDDERYM